MEEKIWNEYHYELEQKGQMRSFALIALLVKALIEY